MSIIRRKTTFTMVALSMLLGLALVVQGCGSGSSTADLVPNISGETYQHGPFDLNSSVGRPAVINFWYPSCPPCAAELPDLQAAYEQYGDRVDFIGVFSPIVDDEETAMRFLEAAGVTYPSLTDTERTFQFDYTVLNYPTTIFVGADHIQRRDYIGGPIDTATLSESIEQLLNDSKSKVTERLC